MFQFDVFDDPSISNAQTADLAAVAADSGATVTTRTFTGTRTAITKAWNLAYQHGWPISRLRRVAS
jgi:hypothetical protein